MSVRFVYPDEEEQPPDDEEEMYAADFDDDEKLAPSQPDASDEQIMLPPRPSLVSPVLTASHVWQQRATHHDARAQDPTDTYHAIFESDADADVDDADMEATPMTSAMRSSALSHQQQYERDMSSQQQHDIPSFDYLTTKPAAPAVSLESWLGERSIEDAINGIEGEHGDMCSTTHARHHHVGERGETSRCASSHVACRTFMCRHPPLSPHG